MNNKDFKWTEKRFGLTFANILKKLTGLSKDSTDGSIEYKDEQGNVSKLVTDSTFSSLLAKNGLIEVKWQELKDKRDNGQLIPGSLYRITDYNCTTTQENTRSAGHQFDIVLLALSEDKLAEEGWAMEHPTDVYDVTFVDSGTVSKCYIYYDGSYYNIVRVSDLIGASNIITYITINEENKTAIIEDDEEVIMTQENLQYSYFQNSNLSAWKVWYCLDNDTSRFAWADDSVPQIYLPLDFIWAERDATKDEDGYFAWHNSDDDATQWTTSEFPKIGDVTFTKETSGWEEGGSVGNIKGFGRGVIYRLIDEWNNDCPYDFKNIQFVRKLTDGEYDPNNGENTWVYTFNLWYESCCVDCSIVGNTLTDDVGDHIGVKNNILNGLGTHGNDMADNVFLSGLDETIFCGIVNNRIGGVATFSNTILGFGVGIDSNTLLQVQQITTSGDTKFFMYCTGGTYEGDAACYILDKKVLTES